MHFTTRPIPRRTLLRGAGAALSLPFLEGMLPAGKAAAAVTNPRRFLSVHVALGMYPGEFFPKEFGSDYALPRLLRPLAKHRNDFTVFSDMEHPEVKGGHRGIVTFLTGTDVYGVPGYDFRNTVSLDQVFAETVGAETRFSSLQLATSGNRSPSSWDIAWTRDGIALPPLSKPRDVFEKLFGAAEHTDATQRRLAYQRRTSLLDRVLDQAQSLDRRLGKADQEKLDEYLTAVREVEGRIEKAEAWANRPKPRVDRPAPKFNSNQDIDLFENMALMYELIALAFVTDSTRSVVLQIPANNTVYKQIDGVTQGYHALSHHGKEEKKIEQLLKIEEQHTRHFAGFLDRMTQSSEKETRLLDNTTVLFGSGLGNASSHSNKNLPVLLAGGGYRCHGQHVGFPDDKVPPLSNLFVSILQNLGVEADYFSGSTGNLNNLV